MQEENEYPQEEVVVEEEITTTEEVAEESNDDTVTIPKSEFNKLRRQAIAYKANKETPKQEVKEVQTTTNFSEDVIEEKILKSKGISNEDINELKALARLRGKSLLEVESSDPLWKSILNEREAELRKKQASLGASRGSSIAKPQKTTTTPNLSVEDHKALWKEQNN